MDRNPIKEMADVVRTVMGNGLAANNIELEGEFTFEAQERGWTAEEIAYALESHLFPWID